jgi:transcriptional regulator with XRE-family HTH domain
VSKSGPKLSREQRHQARQLRQQGLSLAAIGERLGGISRQAVHYVLDRRKGGPVAVCCRSCHEYITTIQGGSKRTRSALCLRCLAANPSLAFAERLKAFRLAAGLTRQELAGQAHLSSRLIHRYEEGVSHPLWDGLVTLMQVLGTELVALGIRKQTGKENPRSGLPCAGPGAVPEGPPGDHPDHGQAAGGVLAAQRPRGRPRDQEQRQRVAELRRQGLSTPAIGRRLGITSQRVHQLLTSQVGTVALEVCCCRCQAIISQVRTAASTHHQKVLCLTCLEQAPEATFGERLRAFRVARGLTQVELQRQLHLSANLVARHEQDVVQPMWKTLVKLMEFLGPELVTLGITKKG